jgi:hypothetical protein
MIGRLFTSVKVQAPLLQLLNSREALERDGNLVTSKFESIVCLLINYRGGVVQGKCGELVNAEAARVVYKNNYSFGVKIFNIYMVGTPFIDSLSNIVDLMSYHRRTVAQIGGISATKAGIPPMTMGLPSQKNEAFGERNTASKNWKQIF